MYQITVTIANPPLAITRHFQCVDAEQADRLLSWVKAQGLTYTATYINPHLADDAIRAIQWELDLAANRRVA